MGLFDSLKNSLEKSRRSLAEKLTSLIGGASALDDDFYDDLEATLIMSDTGAGVASRLIASTRKIASAKRIALYGVGREGLETALFFYATVTAADETGLGARRQGDGGMTSRP